MPLKICAHVVIFETFCNFAVTHLFILLLSEILKYFTSPLVS
jgi:hypothetical protein